jgi:hypothetical protein
MVEKTGMGGNGESPPRVNFDYIKAQGFRVIRADGAIGSVTPSGQIHMSVYSERPPIPRRIVHAITDGGQLGPEIQSERIVRDAIIREMDVDIFMTVEVAKKIKEWLEKQISEAEKLIKSN